MKKNALQKTLNSFTFFQSFLWNWYLKSFNAHISVVVCSFFEFWIVSKRCIRECVNTYQEDPLQQVKDK